MTDKNPSTTLFWNDLHANVRVLSPAAQALWCVWCLALCEAAEARGYLEVRGKPVGTKNEASVRRLAREIGWAEDVVQACLEEIVEEEVCGVDNQGCIYNRRMRREEEIREKRRQAGRRGGKASGASRSRSDEANPQANPKQTPKQNPSKRVSKPQANGKANDTGATPDKSTDAADATEAKSKQEPSKIEPSSLFTLPNNPPTPPDRGEGAKPKRKPKRRGPPERYPEDFERFWKAYPDITNNTKWKALSEWEQLSPDDQAVALAALPSYAKSCRATDTSFLHAERYLKYRRWETVAGAARDGGSVPDRPAPDVQRAVLSRYRNNPASWDRARFGPAPGEHGCRFDEALIREAGISSGGKPFEPTLVEGGKAR